uniref:sensor domain-containing diguanylate cyclase n=1 Tax=Frankia sp. Cppng1_Ct_nod TaxID=2897162 RepID=UPI0020252081
MLLEASTILNSKAAGPGQLRRSVPLVAGLTVVAALGTLVLLIGQAGLRDAERARLSDRSRFVERVAGNASSLNDPERIRSRAAGLSLAPGQSDHNALLLGQFQLTPAEDPSLLVALVDLDGSPIVTIPAGQRIPIGDLGVSWASALAGRPAMSQVFALQGRPVRATVVPVGGDRPWAVLVSVADEAATQQLNENLGALGSAPGGLVDVDARGVAVVSWNPALRGRRVVEPERLVGLLPGTVRVWTSGIGAGQMTYLASVQRTTGYTTVFQQPTARLFADLRAQWRQRDLILLGVLTVCVGGLVVFGLYRERTARRARARLYMLLAGVRDIIVVVGDDRVMTFAGPAVRDLLGYTAASWFGRVLTDFAHPDDRGRIHRLLAEPGGGTAFDIRLVTASGEVRWFDLEASDLTDRPELAGVLITCHEVGERKNLQEQLGYQASHDSLTGLPNRVLFTGELDRAVVAARSGGSPFALLFIDLDHFKPVNDNLGHDAGDAVLRIVAERLARAVREEDLAARLGGDEFGILLRDTDEASADDTASRIIEAVRVPITLGTSVVRIDASIGVAASTLLLEASEYFLRAADRAMYEAKQAGRGRSAVAVASPPRSSPTSGARHLDVSVTDTRQESPVPEQRRPRVAQADRFFSRFAVPRGSATGVRAWLGRLGPPLVAGAVLLAIALVGLWLQTQERHTAEKQRLADRLELATIVADFSARKADPQHLIRSASDASWSLTDRALDERILRLFAASGAGGKNYIWALAALDGDVVAIEPPSATLAIGPGDAAWRTARGGQAGNSSVMKVDGIFRDYLTIPVMRNGEPVAIMVIGESLRDAQAEANLQTGGTLGFSVGGFATVDPSGTVMLSWDAARIGQRLVSRDDLANLQVGRAVQIHPAGAGDQVTLAAPLRTLANGGYLVFQQPASVFYGDIRSGQLVRYGCLLVVVA